MKKWITDRLHGPRPISDTDYSSPIRTWLANSLFKLAMRLDDVAVVISSIHVAHIMVPAIDEELLARKRKPGRPLGSKDKKPRKNAKVVS